MQASQMMARAIEIARTSLNEPGALPYGAVVARDGIVIGEGLNRAMALSDPTSHGRWRRSGMPAARWVPQT